MQLTDYLTNLSEAVGFAFRVCSFLDATTSVQAALTSTTLGDPLLSVSTTVEGNGTSSSVLHINNVNICVPAALGSSDRSTEGRAPSPRVIGRLEPAEVAAARPLFISGASGSGKTSALRVIAGLWPHPEVTTRVAQSHPPVNVPPVQAVFVPGVPRLLGGASLAQNLTYPLPSSPGDADLTAALCACELEHLVPVLREVRADWASSLSGGELQRLMAARVWLQQPAFAFFDEGLAAVDAPVRLRVMNALQARGVGCVFVSHDLPQRHDRVSDVVRSA